MDFLNDQPAILKIIQAILFVATLVTAVTKTSWDNKILNIISKVVNMLAGNVGKNKNADAEN